MIRTKEQYKEFIELDRIALKKPPITVISYLKEWIRVDYIWRFQRLLRKCEYLKSTKGNNLFLNIRYGLYKVRFKRLSIKLGFTIPENVFGPGLAILHYGTIVINAETRVGANCRLHACTNIGQSGGTNGAPVIGDNVYVAPGVKIFGKISIPNNIAIGANSVVNKSFFNENYLIGGIPAKEISKIDISQIIKHI